jgi:rSAM/selenodomain-associated transferase 1
MGLGNHVVVMARAPRLGTVKRRLARGIGDVAALGFYRTALAALLRRLGRDPRWTLWVALTPDRGRLPGPWRVRRQGGGDLGARMLRPLGRPPLGLPAGPALVIGSDVPEVRPAHLAAAFRALGRHDMVFGPAEDGGYWLVGARRRPTFPRDPFRGVRWSTADALSDTLANLGAGVTAARVATLADVDDAASFRRWRSRRRDPG